MNKTDKLRRRAIYGDIVNQARKQKLRQHRKPMDNKEFKTQALRERGINDAANVQKLRERNSLDQD